VLRIRFEALSLGDAEWLAYRITSGSPTAVSAVTQAINCLAAMGAVTIKAFLLRLGDGAQDIVGLTRPLSRQYRATASSIVGGSPNNPFCFCVSRLT
jgi:hypothetical protein